MKIRASFSALFLFILIAAYELVSCNSQPAKLALDIAKEPFKNLSEYNIFIGALKNLKPNERIIPYDLNSSLFTDYAFKKRFVYVPEGKSATYDTTDAFNLPVGSFLVKNFYYPLDFRKPDGDKKIIETRLLVHRANGWDALEYTWNDEQTEATLNSIGAFKEVSWIHFDGSKKSVEYVVPSKNQCKGCHWHNNTKILPIGPKIRNLNKDYAYAEGTENQLSRWAKLGLLSNLPAVETVPKTPNWEDSVHYNLDQRARAYLDMNCGHCHNPKGPAYTSGLYLNWENENPENLGICKTPVAAGKATGGNYFDIVPGKANESIVIHRMLSNDPGVRMPELGKQLIHTEGVALISRWINALNAAPCKL